MLQDLIKNLQTSLKSFSQGLAKQNLLVDIPWTMVDGDLNLQRLIFRKDNSLYIVKEGEIQESRWECLTALNSLIIEIGGKKILMNEVFADGKALIQKKDGVSLEFLSFANQNELPDLNLIGYLEKVTNQGNIKHLNTIPVQKNKGDTLMAYLAFFAIIIILLIALISDLK